MVVGAVSCSPKCSFMIDGLFLDKAFQTWESLGFGAAGLLCFCELGGGLPGW